MSTNRRSPIDYIEPWRAELQVLAASQMGPRLQQKVGPEDVVQDAIINALAAWPTFRGDPEDFKAVGVWLRKIVVNEVYENYRRYSTQVRDMNREIALLSNSEKSCAGIDAYAHGDLASPQDRVLRRERFEKLNKALAQLPPDEAQAVISRYINRLKIREIAELLEMTEKMASDRVFKGIAALLKIMGGDDFWASRAGVPSA